MKAGMKRRVKRRKRISQVKRRAEGTGTTGKRSALGKREKGEAGGRDRNDRGDGDGG